MTDDQSQVPKPPERTMAPRFHAAHAVAPNRPTAAVAAPVEPPAKDLSAVAGKSEPRMLDQIRSQAAELSHHLSVRQRDLARREASFNARCAEYEDQQRAARLWLRERRQELDERAQELERMALQLDERQGIHEAQQRTAEALRQRESALQQREQTLRIQEERLRHESLAVQNQSAGLTAAQNSWERQRQAEEQTLAARRHALQVEVEKYQRLNNQLNARIQDPHQEASAREALAAELDVIASQKAALRAAEINLENERRALDQQRQRWHAQQDQQLRSLSHESRQRDGEFRMQMAALQQGRKQLERRRRELHDWEAELNREQRRLLEVRLAVRQAWLRVKSRLSPQEVQEMRVRVRDHVRGELASIDRALARRRRELQQLAGALAQQQEALTTRHARLQDWARSRQEELDRRAAEIQARAQQIAPSTESDRLRTPAHDSSAVAASETP